MAKKITVVGAVVLRNGLVLCAQRGQGGALPGLWEFPGGKVEDGETPTGALVRELREEFNVDAKIGERVTTTVHSYPFGEVTLTTFYCLLLTEELTLREHQAVVWLHPAELEDLQWAPADLPAVWAVKQKLAAA